MGSYAESLLTPDEKVLMRQRQHWLVLILDSWLAIILWGATIFLIVAQFILPEQINFFGLFTLDMGSGSLIGEAGMVLTFLTLLGGIIVVALRWWWWRTQEFLVTNRRLVLSGGSSTRHPRTARSRRSTMPSWRSACWAGSSTTARSRS